jgi:peptide/nickel transport system substrate-binding protein
MKEFRLKGSEKLLKTVQSFSATEKVVFAVLSVVALISALNLALRANKMFTVAVPADGGSFTEAMVGLPRSINPVLAISDTDKDLSTLIYSGLMKYEDNKLVTDIASKYTMSPDGLVYHFYIKSNVRFHDGSQLTADDVEYTIQKIQDSEIKSPRAVDWSSVTVKKINVLEIQFILKQPYAPFLANTTVGILPKNLWKNIPADQFLFNQKNLEPIGSGPYKVESIQKNKDGAPISYTLASFNKFYNGEPFISNVKISFFNSEDELLNAYKAGLVDNVAGISPKNAADIATSTNKKSVIIHNPIPRVFGIFLNQNNAPVLANKEVRRALDMAVDRKKIVNDVLFDYGTVIDSPLPVNTDSNNTNQIKFDKNGAKDLLSKNGWTINANGVMEKKVGSSKQTIEFSLETTDSPELKAIAEVVKKDWEDIGVKVNIKVYEFGDLSQSIIKTRKYDSLLFGQIINKDLDLYAFWHSSQRNYPGLNIAMYVNSKADKLLEDIRATYDEKMRSDINNSFEEIIKDDIPAIFLYSPEYIYVMTDRINGFNSKAIANHSLRFYGIDKWFINTSDVWKIFISENQNN